MSDTKLWYKPVLVVSGPDWCQGKTGYLDESTGVVFFGPQDPEPTRETEFENAYPANLLTTETIRQKTERTNSKAKSTVTNAFQT